jgi:hypothetical protein
MEVQTKLIVEESRIMIANLRIMDPVQSVSFEKKQMVSQKRDGWSYILISFCVLFET